MQTALMSLGRFYLSSFTGLSKTCWGGIALSFIEATLVGVYYYLSIYFVNALHLNIVTSGFIISFYGAGAILGGIASGKISDGVSPKIISAISLLIQGLAYILLVELRSTTLLMADLFIIGMATYGFITSNHLYVLSECRQDENQKLKAINILSTSSNLGLGISAIIIGGITIHGFSYVFLISGCIMLALSYYLFTRKNSDVKLDRINAAENDIRGMRQKAQKNQRKVLLLVLLNVLFIGCIVTQLGNTYAIYIQKKFPHHGLSAISILFTLNSALVVLFEAPLGNLLKNENKLLMVGFGGFFIGLGMFFLVLSSSFLFAAISCIIYTVGEMIFFSMAQLVCYQNAPIISKGHHMGLYRMAYATSRVAGPSIGSLIYAKFGGDLIWMLSGFIGLISLTSCKYLSRDPTTPKGTIILSC